MEALAITFTTFFEFNPAYIAAVVAVNSLFFAIAKEVGYATGLSLRLGPVMLFPNPDGIFKRLITMFHACLVGLVFYFTSYDNPSNMTRYAVDLGINAVFAMWLYDVFLKFVLARVNSLVQPKDEKSKTG